MRRRSYHRSSVRAPQTNSATETKDFKCDNCPKTFSRLCDVSRHVNNCTRDKATLFCSVCLIQFKDVTNYRAHLSKNKCFPPVQHLFKCTKCIRTFRRPRDLTLHSYLHESPLKCTICFQIFIDKASFIRHTQANCSEHAELHLKCKDCLKTFKNNADLKCHVHSSNNSCGDHFYCNICSQFFTIHYRFLKHAFQCAASNTNSSGLLITNTFSLSPSVISSQVVCEMCNKSVESGEQLLNHLEWHTNNVCFEEFL